MTPLQWCEKLLAFSICIQTVELISLRRLWLETGVWRWSSIRRDFFSLPIWIQRLFDFFLEDSRFLALLILRLACALAVLTLTEPDAALLGVILWSSWLITVRWRATFNGGSDSMTLIVALCVWIGQSFSENAWIVRASLGYMAVQLTASYFIAGWVKLINPNWRNGKALPVFLRTPGYDSPPAWVRNLFDKPWFALMTGLGIIIFECAFPCVWFNSTLCTAFLLLAFFFHLMNFLIFGLNRFVFAWLAAYPALYYWIQ